MSLKDEDLVLLCDNSKRLKRLLLSFQVESKGDTEWKLNIVCLVGLI
ncbi:hypothetical protein IQ10_00264 [Halalkalibacter nanhaiisediminis]|uniref:Uncharacterized protein n=1 Tax=Halalkalibacter nanhaiisediminis TaxID=688079 RepID=A0A562QSW9_9BACI|nr:hypothetical protein IQ10_00264 [Halalkalibacter nanhaiisediminis]